MNKHKCFISFKTEDLEYKIILQEILQGEYIDCSLNKAIDSDDMDYVMSTIRRDYLKDSTVTIFLIGLHSNENIYGQYYIKKELQASLYNGKAGSRNGILGIVLPCMYDFIYQGEQPCSICGRNHHTVTINDDTVIKEFSYNYYLPHPQNGCYWSEDDRYCVLVKWDDFIKNASYYIEKAFQKRNESIINKIKVRP